MPVTGGPGTGKLVIRTRDRAVHERHPIGFDVEPTGSRGRLDRRHAAYPVTRLRNRWDARAVGPAGLDRDALGRRTLGAAATARRDRPRGDGCGAQGTRPGPRPRPGGEGPPGVAPQQSRPDPPLHRGSPDRRPVAAPGDRPDLRAGRLRRPSAVFRHEAGQRPDALEPAGRAAGPVPRPDPLPLDLRGGLPDDRLRPRPRRDPPRPEAVEHHGRLVRRGPGDGLGTRQGLAAGRRGRRRLGGQVASSRHGDRHGAERFGQRLIPGRQRDGHAVLHGSRAGPRRDRPTRRALRRLRPGLDPVRAPHRRAGLHRPILGRDPAQGLSRGPEGGRSIASIPGVPTPSWSPWPRTAWHPSSKTARVMPARSPDE